MKDIILYFVINRAKQKGRPGGVGTHVHVLPTRQPAVARAEGRHVEGALPEDRRHETSDADRGALRRPSRGDGHVPALRAQAGLLRDAGLRVLEEALPRSVRETWLRQRRRVRLDRQDNGACQMMTLPLYSYLLCNKCRAKKAFRRMSRSRITFYPVIRKSGDVNAYMLTCCLLYRGTVSVITVVASVTENESTRNRDLVFIYIFLSNNIKKKDDFYRTHYSLVSNLI